MNSPKTLYEELLKEHPELKNSPQDIQEIITSLQKLNPTVQIDAKFKKDLKIRLENIAVYDPAKKIGYFGILKYFVPVFTFGFAVFGFVYFSQDFEQTTEPELGGMEIATFIHESDIQPDNPSQQPEQLMLMSDIESIESGDQTIEESEDIMLKGSSRTMSIDNVDNQAQELDMSSNMMMQTDSVTTKNMDNNSTEEESINQVADEMVEEIFQDLSENLIEELDFQAEEVGTMQMMMSEEFIDYFENACVSFSGSLDTNEESERICILEDVTCLESEFEDNKCLIEE